MYVFVDGRELHIWNNLRNAFLLLVGLFHHNFWHTTNYSNERFMDVTGLIWQTPPELSCAVDMAYGPSNWSKHTYV